MMDGASTFPPAERMLKQAQQVLGYDLLEVCANAEQLSKAHHSQVALYVSELVAAERLRCDCPEAIERCSAVAGIGVGEFAALTVAGMLDFEDGLALVKFRAEAMQAAAETASERVSMLVVSGLETSRVRELCEDARRIAGEGAVC